MRRNWTNVVATMSIAQFRATVLRGAASKAIVTDADGHYCWIAPTHGIEPANHAFLTVPLLPILSFSLGPAKSRNARNLSGRIGCPLCRR